MSGPSLSSRTEWKQEEVRKTVAARGHMNGRGPQAAAQWEGWSEAEVLRASFCGNEVREDDMGGPSLSSHAGKDRNSDKTVREDDVSGLSLSSHAGNDQNSDKTVREDDVGGLTLSSRAGKRVKRRKVSEDTWPND